MTSNLLCAFLVVLSRVSGQSNVSPGLDIAQELRAMRADFDAKINQCETKIDRLSADIQYMQAKQEVVNSPNIEDTGCNCDGEAEKPRNTRQGPQPSFAITKTQVAFYAQLTYDLFGITDNQTIVFDNEETNIAGGYDSGTGQFTAPVSGVYVFIWTTTNYNSFSYLQSEIMVNGVIKGRQWSDSGTSNDVSSATGSAVFDLKAGDAVWVRTNKAHLGDTLKGGTMSSFSGWLL